ncbi:MULTISPECIES: hypothetical protein [Burkholderiaceae]|uniref:hypothetical protein n=1 Tax=Burkholderiaceae TaxID=119060 RepID=UPI0014212547|nr:MULTISPECIES: hypothetical protein [Burkholderiaceae]MBN3846755.1 hypothetical protein [Paraburkholderia sp. Ac-20342]NIF51238.1 hypothetical protein [Burkholderia sp. Ax-1724]
MQLKHIGIAAAVAAAGLVAAYPWAEADRIGMFDLFAKSARTDAGTGSRSNSDSYTRGHRTDWSDDPYTEGMGSPVIGPQLIPRNM